MSAGDWHGACHEAGISGLCGCDCPVFLDGDCDNEEEVRSECELDEYFEPIINTQRDLF